MNITERRKEVVSNLKACLVSAPSGRIPINQLNSEYSAIIGESIPHQVFGFRTLQDFISTIPELIISNYYVEAKKDEATKHIADLVRNQKSSRRKPRRKIQPSYITSSRSYSRPTNSYPQNRWNNPNKEEVIQNIKYCLGSGGCRFSALNNFYLQMFGDHIQYKCFGFDTFKKFILSIPELTITKQYSDFFVQIRTTDKRIQARRQSPPREIIKAQNYNVEEKKLDRSSPVVQTNNNNNNNDDKADLSASSFYEEWIAPSIFKEQSIPHSDAKVTSQPVAKNAVIPFVPESYCEQLNLLALQQNWPQPKYADLNQSCPKVTKNAGIVIVVTVFYRIEQFKMQCMEHSSWNSTCSTIKQAKEYVAKMALEDLKSKGAPVVMPNDDQKLSEALERLSLPKEPEHRLCTISAPTIPDTELWDVIVTNVSTVCNISFQFKQNWDSFITLKEEMDIYYNNAQFVNFNVVDNHNAIYMDDVFGPSRVLIVNIQKDKVEIVFVDKGGKTCVPVSSLRPLIPKFAEAPAQAVNGVLHSLKIYMDKSNSYKNFTLNATLNKSLVAYVKDRKTIELELYDTSQSNPNMTACVTSKIHESFLENTLFEEEGVTDAIVTDILEDQVIFKIPSVTLDFMNEKLKAIKKTAARKATMEELNSNSIFFLFVPDPVRVTVNETVTEEHIKLSIIDYGYDTIEPLADIYVVEELQELMSKIPAQCVSAELYNIPQAAKNETVLKTFIPLIERIYAELIHCNDRCEIELFKKCYDQLISINENIRMQYSTVEKTVEIVEPQKVIEEKICLKAPEIPSDESSFEVFVSCITSPSSLIIQPTKYLNDLNTMMKEMKNYYNQNRILKMGENMNIRDIFAARLDDDWLRVIILNKYNNSIAVRSIDYGSSHIVNYADLQPLAKEFLKLPYVGLSAEIHGLERSEGWGVVDNIRLCRIVRKKKFNAVIKKMKTTTENDFNIQTLCVELTLKDSGLNVSSLLDKD